MRSTWCLLLLLSSAALAADEAADRTAITASLNTWCASNCPGAVAAGRPMSEVSKPVVQITHLDYITEDVALVDAEAVQFGSLIIRKSTPMLFVIKRQNGEWRIHHSRILRTSLPGDIVWQL